ncbi:prophage tail length tape measure protein [Shigella flexneri 2850-71]|nr:prophage tail length tape measure protein [Shigella flexneri 2850-71]
MRPDRHVCAGRGTGKRTSDIDNNLNALGSTLQTLSDWWKQFWDAAMNIGREDSLDAQIDALQEKIQRAKNIRGQTPPHRWSTISSVLTIFRRKTPEGFAGCKSAGRTELPGATETPEC